MKKRNICMLAGAMVLSFGLCACGAGDSDVAVADAVEETKVEESVTDVGEDAAEVETTEIGIAENAEETVQSTEEETGPQDIWEWVASIDATEPVLTVWNDRNKEGYIFQNNERCILKEGDVICICISEKETSLEFYSPVKCDSYGTDDCKILVFENKFMVETPYEFAMTVAGVEYPFSITLISENAANSTTATENTLSGKEWAATLEYDEPKLIVWNDEMGTKEVIDNGGEYLMQEGDMLGLYHGANCRPFRTEPYEFCAGFNVGMTFSIMECNLPEESQTIDLGVEFSDLETGDFFTYYFTIITP